MKTIQRKLVLSLFALLLTGMLTACGKNGKIPEGYTGEYADQTTGAKLTLEDNAGTVRLATGREIKAGADSLQFDALVSSKPGIYVRPSSDNENELEIFWLFPHPETRKQEADFVWVGAEVLYSRMNAGTKDKVQTMKIIHCEDGMLMLDLPTQSWNGGCPAGVQEFNFIRTK